MPRQPYQVRLAAEEIDAIRSAAASIGIGHTTLLRRAALLAARIRTRPESVSRAFATAFGRYMAEVEAADFETDGRRGEP